MGKLFFLTALGGLLFIFGCSKNDQDGDGPAPDVIWDFTNYDIVFGVTDDTGTVNLLDPETLDNILGDPVTITWRGKEFSIKTPADEEWRSNTRFNMPRRLALRLDRPRYGKWQGQYVLSFGEFSPTSDYKQEKFIVSWGDGTQDVFTFDCYITWKNHKPTVHVACWLNGERCTDNIVFKK